MGELMLRSMVFRGHSRFEVIFSFHLLFVSSNVSPIVSLSVLPCIPHVVLLPLQTHESVSFSDVFTSLLPGVEHRTVIHVSYIYLLRTIVYKPLVFHRYSLVYTL
jgi:hypothetical protein